MRKRIGPPAAEVRGVFEAEQPGAAQMLVGRPNHAFHHGHIEHAFLADQCPARDAAEHRRGTGFVVGDVSGPLDQQFIAGVAVGPEAHLIGLRPRTPQHRGLLAEPLRHAGFQPVHGGILPGHIIAEFRFADGSVHARRGPGDGVAIQIDLRSHE